MKEFPYPVNIIPITYSIIKEIENTTQNTQKNKELQFIFNLPPEYTNSNTHKILNLINTYIINKLQKLYKIKINILIEKNYLNKKDNSNKEEENQFILKININKED
ncbi:MAG: hypothetical protein N2485_02770 [bacterium]|nr:hypothetical protein [bacterium]